jgi:hypothetical protein
VAACGLDVVGAADAPPAAVPDVAMDSASPTPPPAPPPPPPAFVDAGGDAGVDAPVDAGPPFCDASDTSLVLCVQFENEVRDESSYAQPIVESGSVAFGPGKHGQAVVVGDTTTLHMTDGPAWRYTALTVEMWIRPDALPASGGRMGLLDKDASFGVFLYSDGSVACIMGATASAVVLTVGTRTHVACVNDGTTTKLYADGVESASATGAVAASTSTIAIGGNNPSGDPLVGALDELRVTARALSATEIAADAK